MLRHFCSICGKTTDELIENKCSACFIKEANIVHLQEQLEAKVCKNCLTYRSRGRWIFTLHARVEEVAKAAGESAVKDALKLGANAKNMETKIELEELKHVGKGYLARYSANVKGEYSGIPFTASKQALVRVRFELCKNCSRRAGGYYESVLQIRGKNKLSREKIGEIERKVEEMVSSIAEKDRKAFLSEIKYLKEGIDFHIGSVKIARKIANVLKAEFGGSIVESPKLVGRKQGKNIYRTTIALRIYD